MGLGEFFEVAVGVTACLAKVRLLEAFVDRHGDRKQRGEEQRRQRNGENRHNVAGAVGRQAFPAEVTDDFSIAYLHTLTPSRLRY